MDPLLIDVPERIVTPRLVLRVPRAGDGPALNAAVLEADEEMMQWMPWARDKPTIDDSEAFVRGLHGKFILRTSLQFHMWERDGERELRWVGAIGIPRMDWTVPRFEIGYWRRAGCGQRGLMTEAVIAVNRMAFDQLAAQRVELRIDEHNRASWRVAERAGFTLEGTLRNDTRRNDSVRTTRVYARVRGIEEPAA
jgi:RimJ/RimL family protein N-acetyltransferase